MLIKPSHYHSNTPISPYTTRGDSHSRNSSNRRARARAYLAERSPRARLECHPERNEVCRRCCLPFAEKCAAAAARDYRYDNMAPGRAKNETELRASFFFVARRSEEKSRLGRERRVYSCGREFVAHCCRRARGFSGSGRGRCLLAVSGEVGFAECTRRRSRR